MFTWLVRLLLFQTAILKCEHNKYSPGTFLITPVLRKDLCLTAPLTAVWLGAVKQTPRLPRLFRVRPFSSQKCFIFLLQQHQDRIRGLFPSPATASKTGITSAQPRYPRWMSRANHACPCFRACLTCASSLCIWAWILSTTRSAFIRAIMCFTLDLSFGLLARDFGRPCRSAHLISFTCSAYDDHACVRDRMSLIRSTRPPY